MTTNRGYDLVARDALVLQHRFIEFAGTKQNARFVLAPFTENAGTGPNSKSPWKTSGEEHERSDALDQRPPLFVPGTRQSDSAKIEVKNDPE